MKIKIFFFGILILLFSFPLLLFAGLSYFQCGFINDRLCCMVDDSICCYGLEYSGCIPSFDKSKTDACKNYCYEIQSKVVAGFDTSKLFTLNYCEENCTDYYNCTVFFPNGTEIKNFCERKV